MDPDAEPQPEELRELRILVLHNRDFETEPDAAAEPGLEDRPRDLEMVSRADVANVAQTITRALVTRGHFVEVQGIDREDIGDLIVQLRKDPPDLVFNLCETLLGEARHEAFLPALLDLLDVPYTGSGALCLSLCTRKYKTHQILRAASIPTPMATLLPAEPRPRAEDLLAVQGIGYPLFLKLAHGDGSIGISSHSIVHNDESFIRQVESLRERYGQPILAEHYIEGREIYSAMLGNAPRRLLPLWEIDFSGLPPDMPHIVSETAKWDPTAIDYKQMRSDAAAPLPAAIKARIEEVATRTFSALDLWDYGRCDIRLSGNGTPYVIDVNPNCDLSDTAGFTRTCALAGLAYEQVIEEIALSALQRNAHVHAQRKGAASDSPRPPKRSATAA